MPANKKHDEPLSDAEVAEIEKRIDSFPLSPLQARALCATVRALRAENERAIDVLVNVHNDMMAQLQSQLEQVTKERDDLLNRSHQTVLFECGCMFKQEGLDNEPQLITHCAGEQLK